ncbi:MAG: FeoA family protein [Desulfuromonadaceae bacterium]
MMSLELLTPGERGEITEVRHCGGCGGGCHSHDHDQNHGHHKKKATATRAEEMGLRVGKMVEVLKNDGNLLLLLVDEARIAIDRRMARSINVKGVTA